MDKLSLKSKVPDLQGMAETIASGTPRHLGQPTTPPISWAQTGDIITVILADGRKVSSTVQAVNEILFQQIKIDEPTPPLAPIVGADGVRLEPARQPSPPSTRTRRKK